MVLAIIYLFISEYRQMRMVHGFTPRNTVIGIFMYLILIYCIDDKHYPLLTYLSSNVLIYLSFGNINVENVDVIYLIIHLYVTCSTWNHYAYLDR